MPAICSGVVGGDLVKIIWHNGLGMSLYAKRHETPTDDIDALKAALA
jgi:hypothetical protein